MPNEPKFKIGDTVFRAHAGLITVWVPCPECATSGRLRVILGDGTEVSIACVCCERGYEGSPGRISSYRFIAETHEDTIAGVNSEMRDGRLYVCYRLFSGYSGDEENLFCLRAEAASRANELMAEHEVEEAKRLKYKEKQTKMWAWNVSYWRRQIKRAQEDIDRWTAKLNVAPKKGEVPVDA